jgi:HAD superfamily phosphatase (TIGR01668 family)
MIERFLPRKWITPDGYVKTVFDVSWEKLRSEGTDTIFIDLDNTLISYKEQDPDDAIRALFAKLAELGLRVLIVSNNHQPRVRRFADALGVPYLHSAKKPTMLGFARAERIIGGVTRKNVCLVGDQVMTDLIGGKRRGYKVVLVDAIDRESENWFTKHNRTWEKMVLNRLKRIEPDRYEQLNLREKR